MEDLVILVAQVLGAVIAAWAAWKPVTAAMASRAHRKTQTKALMSAVRYHNMSMLTSKWVNRWPGKVERALILTVENCGWTDPSKPASVSIVAETAVSEPAFERWQNWRADTAYRDMLYSMMSAKDRGVCLITEPNPELESLDGVIALGDGALRDYYRERGVVASLVFSICPTKSGGMLYGSVNLNGDVRRKVEIYLSREPIRAMGVEGRAAYGA